MGPFATPIHPEALDAVGRSDPPNEIAAKPIPAIATTRATTATNTRRADEGWTTRPGSRPSISGHRSGPRTRERDSKRSRRSGIAVFLQKVSEPSPASHQVNANRRLGGADDRRNLSCRVPGGVVEDDRGSLPLGQGGERNDQVARWLLHLVRASHP